MRIFKIVFWIVIIGVFGLVVYQDQTFFLQRHALAVHVGSTAYKTMELPLAVLFASFFLLGWLIAYFFGLLERYKAGRANKQLRTTAASQQEALDALKREVQTLRSSTSFATAGAPQTTAAAPTPTEETT
jgi:uncharacterized membrane protein YciS (DUF1049 family)